MRIVASFRVILLGLLCAQLNPLAAAQPKPATTPIVITHVTVINPGKSSVSPTPQFSSPSAQITEVSTSNQFRPPKNARVVDAQGQYLIPGLWDMHVHSAFGDFPRGT